MSSSTQSMCAKLSPASSHNMSTTQQNATIVQFAALREKPARPKRTAKLLVTDRLLGMIVPVAGVILWELLSRSGVFPPNALPAPSVIGQTIFDWGEAANSGDTPELLCGELPWGFSWVQQSAPYLAHLPDTYRLPVRCSIRYCNRCGTYHPWRGFHFSCSGWAYRKHPRSRSSRLAHFSLCI